MRGRGLALGLAVSAIALAAVVAWAVRQPAPTWPDEAGDWAAVALGLAAFAAATCLRAERWRTLVVDQGGAPKRSDLYALTVVGFAGNTVLPARAGDAVRVVLGAPRMAITPRPLIGTLLAERVLDVVVLATLFVVLALAIAGGEGLPEGDTLVYVALGVIAVAALAALAVRVLARRGVWQRVRAFVAPMLASTTALRGRHGAGMLGISLAIWALEGVTWTAVGAAVDVGFTGLEGVYVLALASMAATIPSGPGYAGTVDAAMIVGVRAVGGSAQAAVSYAVLVRFVVFVPITIVGLIVGAVRYGGLRQLVRPSSAAR